jgi:beta-galactosidase
MRLGTAYYPERFPRATWRVDARAMRDAGLELVRIGEFAWSALEPSRDRCDFSWLEDALEVMSDAGLGVVLATPTAAPPIWLARERPEILAVGPDLLPRPYGGRRHTCPTSPAYRQEAARITRALGERYGRHPAIVGWQLDNEPGNHDSARCWCDACQSAFERWLEERYETIDALNRAWGTRFWSGEYPDFGAIRLPRQTMTPHAPSLLLDHRRFSSHQMIEFVRAGLRALRPLVDSDVITINSYLPELDVDVRQLGALTGVAAHDSYPTALSGPLETAFMHDHNLGRAGPRGRSWVMEQQPGPVNWTPLNPPVPDGQVHMWAWQAAMHGVDTLIFFPWRPTRSGQEQYHGALLRHEGTPDRGLHEARRVASQLRVLPAGLLTRPRAPVALLWSFDDAAAIDSDPHRHGLSHRDLLLAPYMAVRRLGLEVDILDPLDPLDEYDLVLAPALHLALPDRALALIAARDAGARVLLGPRALTKDPANCWVTETVPAGLSHALGVTVIEQLSQTLPVTVAEFDHAPAGPWTDILEVNDAEVIATYGGGTHLDGRAAAAGRDGLTYVGFSGLAAWIGLLGQLLDRHPLPDGIECFHRGGHTLVLDHRKLTVQLPSTDGAVLADAIDITKNIV